MSQMNAVKKRTKWQVKPFIALGILLALSLLLLFATLALAPISFSTLMEMAAQSIYLVLLLNFLPVLLLALLLFFGTGNLVLAGGVASFVFLLMAIVNRIKLQLRGDPLMHWDLSLLREVLGILRGFGWGPICLGIGGVALFIVIVVLLYRKIKTGKMPWLLRVMGVMACVALGILLNRTLYSDARLYASLPVHGSFYNMADTHNSRGNIYAFIHNYNAYQVDDLPGYDEKEVKEAIDEYAAGLPEAEAPETRPHIIMVMGESFSDISKYEDAFAFRDGLDPIANFKALGEAFVSGYLLAPARGGGTADTESDVLTGRVTRHFRNAPYSYRTVTRPIEALPSLLSEKLGYEAVALHPGFPWFYNRQNVYGLLGFSEVTFQDAFGPEDVMNTYVTEKATMDYFISMMDSHRAEKTDTPLFAFCVTIANHAPYNDRYLGDDAYNFDTEIDFSGYEMNMLSNYFHMIQIADEELGRLSDYLEAWDEPAVLVYFGDHYPALDLLIYNFFIPGYYEPEGSFVKETHLHLPPYIVWANTAAREQTDIVERAEAAQLPENGIISPNYLGAYVLELLGYDGFSPFFRYTNEMRMKFPVLMEAVNFTPEETDETAASLEDQEALQFFRRWVRYRYLEE